MATALVVSVTVVLFYFAVLGPESHYRISRNPEDWARFGEYVGGTLGPMFAFVAFLLLLKQSQDERTKLAENRRKHTSGVLLEQARTLWTRAYDIFDHATDHREYRPEDSDRWQAAVQLIGAALTLGPQIEDPASRTSYDAELLIARRLFHGLLRLDDQWSLPVEYFRRHPDQIDQRLGAPYPPTEGTLVALYRFALARQPESAEFLHKFSPEELKEWIMGQRYEGLVSYVRELRGGDLNIGM